MDLITPLLLIVGGILAISSLIISKKPDAKAMIDKLTPYQAFIGVAMLACGIWWILKWISLLADFNRLKPLFLVSLWGVIACSILLGFLFGMPQIAKWIPGDSTAETKANEFAKKVAPYQVILGLIGLACALVYLLYRFTILR
ncbi:MAG: hypothetical protein JWO36_42 [Myxococcales bacterium]|nr:hypothetical protein [Myxococcales bacterium]